MRLDDFSFTSDTLPSLMSRAAEFNQYIERVKAENFIQIGVAGEDETRALPAILNSIEISDALLVDDVDTQSKSGSIKIISGWADCDLKIDLILIDIPQYNSASVTVTPNVTRFDCLKEIARRFKQMKDNKPRVFTVLHPHIAAWGVREFVFNKLTSTESRGKRLIYCTLEFNEFDSVSGKSQDRQLGVSQTQAQTATAVTPVIGDKTRAGLGELEGRFAKL